MTESAQPRSLRIVMFVYGDVTHDSRVLREAGSLADAGHRVTVIARTADVLARTGDAERRDGFEIRTIAVPGAWRRPWRVVGLPARLVARAIDRLRPGLGAEETLAWLVIWRFAIGGWARAAAAAAPPADVFHGHDLTGLPAAVAARRRLGGLVVYDSHEIFLESGAHARRPAWIRRRIAASEQRMIAESAAVVTVNEAILAELGRRYRLPRGIAVHNCSPRWTPPPERDARLRAAMGVDPEAQVALYHGSFGSHRGLEELAAAALVTGLERLHVAYLGYGSQRSRMERLAAEPRFGGRIHILDAVLPDELPGWISGADVDVLAIQPSTVNHRLSTPNKLFEAIAAGVPVVASDFPAIRAVVDDVAGPLGELCDPSDPRAIAAAIERILDAPPDERADLRRRCLTAAHEHWNWETESARLIELYRDLGAAA
jgi:glycosyltransferase involved in cell wall biosynthesis